MRIAVDAMGGDYAPRAVVEGAVDAARELGVGIVLVGDEGAVRAELDRLNTNGLNIEVRHARWWTCLRALRTRFERKKTLPYAWRPTW
jgi:fatty acid/phospholipid biosynthesis enzyme